ncbi:MAG: DUF3820 family protein [Gammaproteobacteria bacterium]|nr:DUF3820 family protein [Gammaproteobacteria bacterium]
MGIKGTYGDPRLMSKLANYRMPFGKHFNVLLIDLPQPYLNWFCKNGFPQSELGELMRIVHETNADGMENLFEPLRKQGVDQYPGEPNMQLPQALLVDIVAQAGNEGDVVTPARADEYKHIETIRHLLKRDIPMGVISGYETEQSLKVDPIDMRCEKMADKINSAGKVLAKVRRPTRIPGARNLVLTVVQDGLLFKR